MEKSCALQSLIKPKIIILEEKAIKAGDIFRGYVSMLKMPVQGVNAAMSIAITDIINPKTQSTIYTILFLLAVISIPTINLLNRKKRSLDIKIIL